MDTHCVSRVWVQQAAEGSCYHPKAMRTSACNCRHERQLLNECKCRWLELVLTCNSVSI